METKIDIVYKLGEGSSWGEYEELRYSIRSIVQNFEQLGNIYIVGSLPNWIQNIIHIPDVDYLRRNKDGNLTRKLLKACQQESLSDLFLNFSDDQFILQKVTERDFYIPFIENKHINNLSQARPNKWIKRLKRTVQYLHQQNLKFDCFESHIPTPINKHLFQYVFDKIDYEGDIGYCYNTMYFNSIKVSGRQVTPNDLCRLIQKATIKEIEEQTQNVKFFNYTTGAFNHGVQQFLQKSFPNKSPYEK